MKEGGYLVYKCRRCGGINTNTHSPQLMEDMTVFLATGRQLSSGNPMIKHPLHCCADGNLGVMDLIGGEYDED